MLATRETRRSAPARGRTAFDPQVARAGEEEPRSIVRLGHQGRGDEQSSYRQRRCSRGGEDRRSSDLPSPLERPEERMPCGIKRVGELAAATTQAITK